MGNPSILNRDKVPAGRRWRVYKLRRQGQKVVREAIIETAVVGIITIEHRGITVALLADDYGIDHARLENVCIRRLLPTGDMLLHGTELHQTRRELRDDPQGWWCVPLGE